MALVGVMMAKDAVEDAMIYNSLNVSTTCGKVADKCKIPVVEYANSCITHYTQVFEFDFEIHNSGKSRSNPRRMKLKD